jgi:glucose-1-phosphate adenylyltransferase
MGKKRVVAMVLAGGKGSRLNSLTKDLAKPAVPFGGKYRIIDFTLSNCSNSGIDTVGVLTQYHPLLLNSYIGIGTAWDLDRRDGGVTVLPPYSESTDVKWYTGTASAVFQNLHYLYQYQPDYVLVLSGDHIYKMDYEKMLEYHIHNQADVTISVVEVPLQDSGRFGIMNTDQNLRILEFEEKPKYPKNNLASMGIYIFNWKILCEFLERDEQNPNSSHDFGKDVIPMLIEEKKRLFAYPFSGYWKDVGTVKSLWEANMDLLDREGELNLFDNNWTIYSVNPAQPPQYLSPEANVKESIINEGSTIEGDVEKSVLFQGVRIGKGSIVKETVVMSNAIIGQNVRIEKAIVPCDIIIPDGTVIRSLDDDVILVTNELINKLYPAF